MKQALLVFFSALLCAACPTGVDGPSDQDSPPGSTDPGFMTVTGFSESIPTLNAYAVPSELFGLDPGYVSVVAAEGLDCDLWQEYADSMSEASADYQETGDLAPYYSAARENWNGYVDLPTWWVQLVFHRDDPEAWSQATMNWVEPLEEGGFEPSFAEGPSGTEATEGFLGGFVESEITDLSEGVVGTFEFTMSSGWGPDASYEQVRFEVDAPTCEWSAFPL